MSEFTDNDFVMTGVLISKLSEKINNSRERMVSVVGRPIFQEVAVYTGLGSDKSIRVTLKIEKGNIEEFVGQYDD